MKLLFPIIVASALAQDFESYKETPSSFTASKYYDNVQDYVDVKDYTSPDSYQSK
jgi:hypothetical protein